MVNKGMSIYNFERYWYQPRTKTLKGLPILGGSHTIDVYDNPEQYGLDNDLSGMKRKDYDGLTLVKAMKKGWVRVRFNRRQPDYGSNVEGMTWPDIRRTVEMLANEVPTMKTLIVVRRRSDDDRDAESYKLDDEGIEFLLKRGRPPRNQEVNAETGAPFEPMMAAEDIEVDEIRRRAGLVEAGAGASRIVHKIQTGTPFFAISAFRTPIARGLENNVVKNRHINNVKTKELRSALIGAPVSYIPVVGGYQEEGNDSATEEKSFFVIPRDTEHFSLESFIDFALSLTRKFGQESVLVGDGRSISLFDRYGHKIVTLGDHIRFARANINPNGWTRIRSHKFSVTDQPAIKYGSHKEVTHDQV